MRRSGPDGPAEEDLPGAAGVQRLRPPHQPRVVLPEGTRQPLQPRRPLPRPPQPRHRLGGVGGGVGEELAAGAGVAEGAERAGERAAGGGGVVLVGGDGADDVAHLRGCASVMIGVRRKFGLLCPAAL